MQSYGLAEQALGVPTNLRRDALPALAIFLAMAVRFRQKRIGF
jgi:hypothetical protein